MRIQKLNWIRPSKGINLYQATAIVAFASIIGYLISMIKAILIAAKFGVGWEMDTFLWVQSFVNLFALTASGPITSVIIPIYRELKNKGDQSEKQFSSSIITILLFLSIIAGLLIFLLFPLFISNFGKGFNLVETKLARELFILLSPIIIFSSCWVAIQSILNGEKHFFISTLSTSLPPLFVIIFLMLARHNNAINLQAIALSIGAFTQFIILLIIAKKKGLINTPSLNFCAPGIITFIKLIAPLFITQILISLLPIIDRILASRFDVGTISALGYAQTLMNMIAMLFLVAMQTAILPYLSDQMASNGREGVKHSLLPALKLIIAFLTPVSVIIYVLSSPLITILFQRGQFTPLASSLTKQAFEPYVLGIVPMALTFICSRGFNAIQDSLSNAVIGSVFFVTVKIGMNYLLIALFGFSGIAISNSVAYTVASIAMLLVLNHKLNGIDLRGLGVLLVKSLVCAVISGILAKFGYEIGDGNIYFGAILGTFFGLGGMILISYILKIKETLSLITLVVKKLHVAK